MGFNRPLKRLGETGEDTIREALNTLIALLENNKKGIVGVGLVLLGVKGYQALRDQIG
jgi:hypothetical protein